MRHLALAGLAVGLVGLLTAVRAQDLQTAGRPAADLAAVDVGPADEPPASVAADVSVTRVSADRWRVDYTFAAPVSAVLYGPPAAGYRERAWRPLTPGAEVAVRGSREALVSPLGPVSTLSVEVGRHTAYAPNQYAPQVPFSDGGIALYLGFFAGDVFVDGAERPLAARFRVTGRAGDHVVAPDGPHGYVYVGPQRPVETADARLVVDPGAPAWLREAFDRASRAATDVFADRLGALPRPPLVLVGAGTLDAVDGVEVKGGAIGGQVVYLVEGRALRDEDAGVRAVLERLVAHELAHVWQAHSFPTGFSGDEPWLHEGSAEAMALHALAASGLWTPAQVEQYADRAAERCRAALGDGSLAEAVRRGAYDAVYACGLGLFRGADPLAVWAEFAAAVTQEGRPYSEATLRRLRSPVEE